MNKPRRIPALLLAMWVFSVLAISQSADAQSKTSDSPAQQWLEKLKELKGDWTTPDSKEITVNYKVVAGGTAVMETDFPGQPHEMISMYFLDGDDLMMQHYCMLENQPRFKAVLPAKGSTLEFEFVGGTNIDVNQDAHIHSGQFTFESKNRLRSKWIAFSKGKATDTHEFELVRKSNSQSTLTKNLNTKKENKMARFMFVYRSSKEQHLEDISPEQMQKIMEAWNGWIGQGMQEGWMVDPGDALKIEGRVVNHDKVVSDGPFAESKEIVGGFSIIQAENFEAACAFAKSCPATSDPGSTVEIRELAGFGAKEE